MDLNKQLGLIAKALKVNFTLNQRPISVEEIFSNTGLLPAIVKRADQLSSLCLGYGLGVTFAEAENAVLGVRVSFDEVTPNNLRYLCILDVLQELVSSAGRTDSVSLDELMYD